MTAIFAFLATFIWPSLSAILLQFWMWIFAAGLAILGFLFSPTIRKYTISFLIIVAMIGSASVYSYNKGYDAPHAVLPPQPAACSDFRKYLVTGPATDKAIAIFKQHDLCV